MSLIEMVVRSEDGFPDVELGLSSMKREIDGRVTVLARAVHDGRKVGFAATLGNDWNSQQIDDLDEPVRWGEVELHSFGAESDAFLQILAKAYGVDSGALRMVDRIKFLAVSLSGNPLRIDDEPLRIKLFFDNDVEDEYAEFFLNIDKATNAVQVAEKDEDYRTPVIRCLSAAAVPR